MYEECKNRLQCNTEVKYGHILVVIMVYLHKKRGFKKKILYIFTCMQFMYVVLNATNALSKSSVTCFTGICSFLLDCQIKVERHTLGHRGFFLLLTLMLQR